MSEPIHIISLGAGVQSSTMALMAAKGEIGPMPTAAIFADTQDEPDEVYEYLEWLGQHLPFPILKVSEPVPLSVAVFVPGSVKGAGPKHYIGLPTHQNNGFGQRHCTKYFKVLPIRRKAREIAQGRKVFMWIGISTDEVSRAKDSGVKWLENTWPLLDRGMNRHDCLNWLAANGYRIPPKSACIYCPYNSDAMWRRFVGTKYWERIVAIDCELNKRGQFLHRSKKPISEVDFSTEEERGQLNMFNNECEGMCGV